LTPLGRRRAIRGQQGVSQTVVCATLQFAPRTRQLRPRPGWHRLARDLGFCTTVAAPVAGDDRAEAEGLHALLDAAGVPPEDRLVRRVAQTGFADAGVRVGIDGVWPEPP